MSQPDEAHNQTEPQMPERAEGAEMSAMDALVPVGQGDPPSSARPDEVMRDMALAIVGEAVQDAEIEAEIRRISRRSFLWGGGAVAGLVTGWQWLISRRADDGIPWPFRRALEFNEQIGREYYRNTRLAPTFDRALRKEPRPNGNLGLSEELNAESWRLRVRGLHRIPPGAVTDEEAAEPTLLLTLADIRRLPRVEMVTELKCIEGWSEIVEWAGARLADFIALYPPTSISGDAPNTRNRPEQQTEYVSLATPDGEYYVGLEMASALHPQTLLCYEMNGAPLTPEHGAPLRLVIPVNYGIKHIKRIGTLRYTQRRPADYWAEQGYDWYSGH